VASPDPVCPTARLEIRERSTRGRASRTERQRRDDDRARDVLALALVERLTSGRRDAAVSCYLSAGTEPGTSLLVDALAASGHPVLVPRLGPLPDGTRRGGPDWAWYAGREDLRPGLFGIPEPSADGLGPDALSQAIVVVASALRAGTDGSRLGTGGGWYDRALVHAAAGTPVIVLLNDDEIESVPQAPHDRPIDWIVTPTRTVRCHPRFGPPTEAEYH